MNTARAGTVISIVGAAVIGLLGLSATAVSAATDGSERHCVVEVVGQEDGVLITGPEQCFDNKRDADSYTPKSPSRKEGEAAASSNTIGTHFSGTSYTGSSIRIVGTVCSGGVWPATGSWNNNIESSLHHCGAAPTAFFDGSSCTGASRSITSSRSTLLEMNNRTSCVRYG